MTPDHRPGRRRRNTDNADEAEAFARRMHAAPALTLTGAQVDALRRALTEAKVYASRKHKIAPSQLERVRANVVLDAVKEALPALDPNANLRRPDTS